MVSNLYFTALMLLVLPFSPICAFIFPVMFAIRIYFEKYVSLKYYSKPKSVWVDEKSGFTYIVFYLCTLVIVGIPFTMYVLSKMTFAKDCIMQDDHVSLCLDTVTAANTCTLDSASSYYAYFSSSTNCVSGYPACVCDHACGPFIAETNGFAIVKSTLKDVYILEYIYEYFLQYSFGAWLLVCLFFALSKMRKNSIEINAESAASKENEMFKQIELLENEKKKQEKLIARLKLLEIES